MIPTKIIIIFVRGLQASMQCSAAGELLVVVKASGKIVDSGILIIMLIDWKYLKKVKAEYMDCTHNIDLSYLIIL